ncbi:response regulator [Rhizobium mesoamericanum]|uniref:Response regulator receiver protein n=1 Tax=Rhizobium mesoamericanum STM3625 TaxID=1211777 RepID=K0Q491_9HYPH|nr:response regulator [Rhizobium mesoamericanum]CCM79327.1 Response regulator receiver protein [Rhizobium mesoamericanum STM3625]
MNSAVESKPRTSAVASQSVLIVEDELLIAMDLESTVKDMGLDVIGLATNKEQALRLAPKANIAFVDVNLSDGATGPEIGRRLIDEFGVTVIFMTGNPEAVTGRIRGALSVVSKPATPANVQSLLMQALRARRDRAVGM